jgi:hypothetical protein
MTLKQIASLGGKLVAFLGLFADCFGRQEPRELLRVYVEGQLSDLKRKTPEGIALRFRKAPRTLQRFLESIKWKEPKLRDRCQQIVATAHAHPEAIGMVDESGVAKSGSETVGVDRQWCGNRGKVENCVVAVHLSYAAPGFQCLLDSTLYLPEEWANDPVRRKKTTFPTKWCFAPSRRSPWNRSIGRWAMASEWPPGHLTNCTGGTTSSWTAWRSESRPLSRKFRSISTAGCESRTCFERGQK